MIELNGENAAGLSMKKSVDDYYLEGDGWDKDKALKTAKIMKYQSVGIMMLFAVCVILGVVIAGLFPLKTYEPIVVRFNTLTGSYDVRVGAKAYDALQLDEPITIADLSAYVRSREGFTRPEAEFNYSKIMYTSCGEAKEQWNSYMLPANPKSPINTYQLNDLDKVENTYVSFLPSDKPEFKTAQIRFTLIRTRAGVREERRYISTAQYRYDRSNIPKEHANIHYNATGFCVTNYRRAVDGSANLTNEGETK